MVILADKFSSDHNDYHRRQEKVSRETTAKKTRVFLFIKPLIVYFLISTFIILIAQAH